MTVANARLDRSRWWLGMRSRIRRLFVYQWFGAARGARFDAGRVDPDGTPRRAYAVVRRHSRSRR
jgi:hypothetical protein